MSPEWALNGLQLREKNVMKSWCCRGGSNSGPPPYQGRVSAVNSCKHWLFYIIGGGTSPESAGIAGTFWGRSRHRAGSPPPPRRIESEITNPEADLKLTVEYIAKEGVWRVRGADTYRTVYGPQHLLGAVSLAIRTAVAATQKR